MADSQKHRGDLEEGAVQHDVPSFALDSCRPQSPAEENVASGLPRAEEKPEAAPLEGPQHGSQGGVPSGSSSPPPSAHTHPEASGSPGDDSGWPKLEDIKNMHPLARGVGVIVATPLLLAGALMGAVGAVVYGVGQVFVGVGDIITGGSMKMKAASRVRSFRGAHTHTTT